MRLYCKCTDKKLINKKNLVIIDNLTTAVNLVFDVKVIKNGKLSQVCISERPEMILDAQLIEFGFCF